MTKTILVRYGELALKGTKVRKRFEAKLIDHIKAKLPKAKVTKEWGRVFVKTSWKDARKLGKVFGIVSFSFCEKFAFKNLDTLCKKALKLVKIPKGSSFAIRARRAGSHKFTSQDVAIKLGDLVRRKFAAKVNLSKPDHTVELEVRQEDAYLVLKTEKGPGGLPFGTAGKVVCTLSGGIDSPVAAWMMMKRGCEPIFVHGVMAPLGGDGKKVKRIVKKLKEWSPKKLKVYFVPHGEIMGEVVKSCKSKLTCLLCKRLILRYAEAVASREKALGITMGDSLGQVASQTLENLQVESHGINYPIFRPLIGMDKVEAVRLAREIGTFDESIKNTVECGALPKRVETCAKLDTVLEEDAFLELSGLAEKAVSKAKAEEI